MAQLGIATTARPPQADGYGRYRRAVRAYWPSVLAVVIGAAISFGAYLATQSAETENEQLAVNRRASINAAAIQAHVNHYLQIGVAVRALFAPSGRITRGEFHTFASQILEASPEIWSISYMARVRDEDRVAFEAAARRDGVPTYAIVERDREGRTLPAARRTDHLVLHYLETKNRAQSHIGFDVASVPDNIAKVLASRDTGEPSFIGDIPLDGSVPKEAGFIVQIPMYSAAGVPRTVEERRATWIGATNVVLKLADVFNSALGPSESASLDVYLIDRAREGTPKLLYARAAGNTPASLTIDKALADAQKLGSVRTVNLADREWTAAFIPRFSVRTSDRRWTAPLTLALGLALTALIAGYLFLLIDRNRKIGDQVAARTAQIRAANEQLEFEIAERRTAEEHAAAAHARLLDAINSLPSNFLLWDADDRLVLWNEKAERSFNATGNGGNLKIGIRFGDFIANTFNRIREYEGSDNKEAWIEERSRIHREGGQSGELHLHDGRWLYVSEHKAKEGGTASIYFDVTDRKRIEQKMRATNRMLEALIQSCPVPITVANVNDLVELWNPAAERIFGWTAAEVTGQPIPTRLPDRQFMRGRVRDMVVREGKLVVIEDQRFTKDGRTIDVEIHAAPLRDDSGAINRLVVLAVDITERKRAEKELRAANRMLEALIQSCPLPILVVDSQNCVELWNPAAERTYGWTAHEAVGKPVPYLPPGRERRGMVRAIVAREGKLVGMEDQRVHKDGRTIEVQVFAAPLRDDSGEIARMLVATVDITERKAAEAALRESEERYRALIAHAPDAMIVHDAEQILFANDAAAALYGSSSPQALLDLGHPSGLLHPDDRAGIETKRREALIGRCQVAATEVRWIRQDGSIVRIEATATPIEWDGKPCVLIEARDITERKLAEEARREAEAALRESEDRYRHLIEMSPDAIFVHIDGRIRFANASAARLIGARTPEELVGQPVLDHVHPDFVHVLDAAQKAVHRDGRAKVAEIKWRRMDGESIFVEVSAAMFTFQGEPAVQVIARDVTARRAAETAMREAKDAAEAANRSKSEFLANVSHELRTPLNAIIGFSEVMEHQMFGKLGNEHYREYARDIRISGSHLLEVINDILDLAKVEAGKIELQEQTIDVEKVIESTVRLVRERAGSRNIELSVNIPEQLPHLWADERKVKQILINLLSNAIKFTPEGGAVMVSAERDDSDTITLSVADTGIGIAKESLEIVLQPFGQVDSALSRKHAGTGLGLPLTKSLVELHGGRLDFDSEVGRGTTVTVRFPHDRLVA